jgi:flagellum-specific peptidoglycan hydrolase FlgJ
MKNGTTLFLSGLFFGIVIAVMLLVPFFLSREIPAVSSDDDAKNILNDVIAAWTSPHIESPSLAGFPSKIELPDAHSGFFPDTVIRLAKEIDSLYNIPFGVTLCQFALESNWGQSNLGLSNYFGLTFDAVKNLMPNPRWAYRNDLVSVAGEMLKRRPVRFAEFNNIQECFIVRAKYLCGSKRYARAFKTRSAEKFARELAAAGYAQDPDYALKLVTIIRRYHLN